MDTKKVIILGNMSNMIDKDLYYEFLQFIEDVYKWEQEMIKDVKLSAKVYETSRDISLPIR